MTKSNLKLITALLVLLSASTLHSAELENSKMFSQVNLDKNDFNKKTLPEKEIQGNIQAIFNKRNLERINKSNEIDFLKYIDKCLNNNSVKNYFMTHGGVETERYNDLIKKAIKFVSESKQMTFNRAKYLTNFSKICNDSVNRLIVSAKDLLEEYKKKINSQSTTQISQLKLNILNKIVNYLDSYYEKSENLNVYSIRLTIYNSTKNQLIEIFDKIALSQPLHKLLKIEENFFNNIYEKIKATQGSKQLENIYMFILNFNQGNSTILLYCNDSNTLQSIIDILSLQSVKDYFSKNGMLFESGQAFIQKVKKSDGRQVQKSDKDKYKKFITDEITMYFEICDTYQSQLSNIIKELEKRKPNDQITEKCLQIAKTMKEYMNNFKQDCTNKQKRTADEWTTYFHETFVKN